MKNDKPLILISNDDGFSSKGLGVLVETLAGLGQIVVMAPDGRVRVHRRQLLRNCLCVIIR